MITSATIENFKCFKRLNFPDLSRITLLGGRNNVGKTATLEALAIFYGRVGPRMFYRYLAWRGIRGISNEPDFVMAPLFRNYQVDNKISISIVDDGREETMEIEFHPSYQHRAIEKSLTEKDNANLSDGIDENVYPPYIVDITYKSKGEAVRKAQIINDAAISEVRGDQSLLYPQNVVYVGVATRSYSDSDVFRFGQLDIIGKQDIILAALRILEPRLHNLSSIAVGQKPLIHGDIGIGRKIPIAHMGEGMGRLLSIALAIAVNKNGLILIDEFEHGIHHSAMPKIWESISKMAQEFNCQIISTTHSYECLQAAFEGTSNAGLADEFRYIRLDRNEQNIVAKTFTHPMIGAAIDRGWEVR